MQTLAFAAERPWAVGLQTTSVLWVSPKIGDGLPVAARFKQTKQVSKQIDTLQGH